VARFVRDDGPPDARLVLIGEAPGYHEEQRGVPFVGPSGYALKAWWAEVGLAREHFYITNTYPYRPPGNKLAAIPRSDLEHWVDQLHDRLAALTDPWLIVPTGDTALRALTGKSGISKYRGSIYEYVDRRGRAIKVIPTYHPAYTFRDARAEATCRLDWARIAADATFRELDLPEREHFIRPTLADCESFLQDAAAHAELLSIDIETPRELVLTHSSTKAGKRRTKRTYGPRRITSLAFSMSTTFSLTIPTTESYWRGQLGSVWAIVRALCALPCPKVGQNAVTFDQWWMARAHDIPWTNYIYDTRWMHHCLDANRPHDLAYQASTLTREPYWKDDHKGESGEDRFDAAAESDPETFWRYNGKDAAVTLELAILHAAELEAQGRWPFYLAQYVALYPFMLAVSLNGLPVDRQRQRRRHARFQAAIIRAQDKLSAIAGEPLYGAKGALSHKKMARFLYETLKLPPQRKRGTKKITTDEVAVRKLMLRHAAKMKEPGELILDIRRHQKLLEFVAEGRVDDDDRMRCSLGFTETLRFAAAKAPDGGGANLLNQDRELRDGFVAPPGTCLIEIDLSQAEDRIVKMLAAGVTSDPDRQRILRARARALPHENDEHTRAASVVFYNDQKAATSVLFASDPRVTKSQRYMAKRGRHASNYGMQGLKLSEELLKDGFVVTPDEGDHIINTILDRDVPEVREWQRWVRARVMSSHCLANSWGHILEAPYDRLNDELYRRFYAFQPQSEVPMLVNQWGLLPLRTFIDEQGLDAAILLQTHDGLLIASAPNAAWPIISQLRRTLERPRIYFGEPLVIPMTVKVGRTWACPTEFKQFPTERELTDAAHAAVNPG
jgi:uracil-DNA glycosylase family 4